jgi:hypothetical protein
MRLLVRTVGPFILAAFAGLAFWAVVRGIQEEPAILGALATAASAIAVVALQQRGQQRDAIREARREQLAPMYEGITTQVRTIGKESGPAGPELEEFMASLQDKLLIWGPAPVVRAWAHAMRVFESEPEPRDAMLAYAELLRAVRQELGHDDSTLDTRDLLRLFVNDIDDHLPAPGRA